MNKPCYAAIKTHSRHKPVLIFVSSRRQTRLTAMDLIAYNNNDDDPINFFMNNTNDNTDNNEKDSSSSLQSDFFHFSSLAADPSLSHSLRFGIGLHHAGLIDSDKALVEKLFREQKILVLVATSTLAWGMNLPAHLVIIKGKFIHAHIHSFITMRKTYSTLYMNINNNLFSQFCVHAEFYQNSNY